MTNSKGQKGLCTRGIKWQIGNKLYVLIISNNTIIVNYVDLMCTFADLTYSKTE